MAAQVNEEENEKKKMTVLVTLPRPCRPDYAPDALKVVALEVSSDDTVASVKATLQDMVEIPPSRQRLVFACSALPDDDDTTLAEHGVVHSSMITLVETEMQVFVKRSYGSTMTISGVETNDTVESFRLRVQDRSGGIRPAWQRLLCSGKQMKDGHTLADYGVRNDTTLQLLLRWMFNLRTRKVELDIDVRDTVGRIKERVEEEEGVPVECQRVLLRGKELDDGRMLTHYNVFEEGTFVKIECRRLEGAAATNTTAKGEGDERVTVKETVKRRANVTGLGKKNKDIPALQWRRFSVDLLGPELARIYPSSCDLDPVC
jgi:hypothetical protein